MVIKLEHYYAAEKRHMEAVILDCVRFFNDAFGEMLFTEDNLKVDFLTVENGVPVYETFCGQFFPKYMRENYTAPGVYAHRGTSWPRGQSVRNNGNQP